LRRGQTDLTPKVASTIDAAYNMRSKVGLKSKSKKFTNHSQM